MKKMTATAVLLLAGVFSVVMAGGVSQAVAGPRGPGKHIEQHHHKAGNKAGALRLKGMKINARLDAKGAAINARLDRKARQARRNGNYRLARILDRRGDLIERRLDRKGDRIEAQLRRKSRHGHRHGHRHVHRHGTNRSFIAGIWFWY